MTDSPRWGRPPLRTVAKNLLAPALAALALSSCVLELDNQADPLRMAAVVDTDTVSIYPRIAVAFTEPLADSTVDFEFSPPFYDFYTQMNPTADSADIVVTGMLRGATRYVIQPAHRVSSRNGAVLKPGRDSLVIHTFPAENEPNNSAATADSLVTRAYGVISTANDTDSYVCLVADTHNVYLNWYETAVTFRLVDANGNSLAGTRPDGGTDTIAVPDTLVPPLVIRVFAPQQLSGARYEVGIAAGP